MIFAEIGIPTHHTRVERWECDYNDHWNTRFYVRSFQMAAEAVATPLGGTNPGASVITARHMRFHRELTVSAPVEVRSAVVVGGAMDGAVVHLLRSARSLAATALDFPGGARGLPGVSHDNIGMALPRGLTADPVREGTDGAGCRVLLGPVRPHELDHTGAIPMDGIIRFSAIASHDHLNRLGFTPTFSDATRINRMAVESRVTLGKAPVAGTPLRAVSRLLRVGGRNFWTVHHIQTDTDDTVATVEQCLVTVNLETRRAVDVPQFLHDAVT